MKSFSEYLTEMNLSGPSGKPYGSRDLEGFRSILDSLKIQAKGVTDPEIKQKIYKFYENDFIFFNENGINYKI